MKLDNDNIVSVWLKARDVYETALVASYTSPKDGMYEDRLARVSDALKALLTAVEEVKS